jgi:predicted Zn-dependent peptidase
MTAAAGVPVLVRERAGADVTSVSVWILVGSRDEADPGVAHLLEHVVMQAVPAGRELRVIDEIESYGGEANAVTTRDSVVLQARVPTVDAPAALAVLMAAATTSTFDDDVVEAERRVVLEELRLAAADPTDIVHDVFFATAFGAHPMGRPVGGTPANVARLDAGHLAAWARTNVRVGTVGVVVCGGSTVHEVSEVVRDWTVPAGTEAPRRPADPPVPRSGRQDLELAGDTAAVILGGPAFALTDPRLAAADVVMELLAGGNASPLIEGIRSTRGLSYDISSDVTGYPDVGVWRVAMSTAPEHSDEVVELATELIHDAVRRGWTREEVARAGRRVAGLLRLDAESSLEHAFLVGRYALVGGWADWSLPAHLDRLASIDADEVNECARLMVDRLVVATAGGACGGDRRLEFAEAEGRYR